MNRRVSALGAVLVGACSVQAGDVLVLSSGDPVLDDLVVQALRAGGHLATVGPDYLTFDGTGLAGVDAVYLQPNFLWGSGDMPAAGQAALRDFVFAGGGLVTAEWTIWKTAASLHFQTLVEAFPAEPTVIFTSTATATFRAATNDPVLVAGLPAEFTFPLTSYSGTETLLEPRVSAGVFFESVGLGTPHGGVVGWDFGEGRVINLSTTTGANELMDANFRQLFANIFAWVIGEGSCYPDCDRSGALDIFDFLCFQDAFTVGVAYADCDGSNILDIFDFLCFQDAFVAGCP